TTARWHTSRESRATCHGCASCPGRRPRQPPVGGPVTVPCLGFPAPAAGRTLRRDAIDGGDAMAEHGEVLPGTVVEEAAGEGTAGRAADGRIERELHAAGAAWVAGVDEVGRGAWAGPVVVCAAL